MFVFLIFLIIVILVVVFICIGRSKPSSSSYIPPAYLEEPSDISNRRPKISAEVNTDFYESVQEYCKENSMTISALIRKAVEAYMNSNTTSISISTPLSNPAPRKSSVIRSDGSWKCPRCGKNNDSYIGTCSCGVAKDSAPFIKPAPRKPSYIRADGSWKCPKCGNVNASYVGSCSCGKNKE